MWKSCPNYETSYEVSDLWRVRSVDRIRKTKGGYFWKKIIIDNINQYL